MYGYEDIVSPIPEFWKCMHIRTHTGNDEANGTNC